MSTYDSLGDLAEESVPRASLLVEAVHDGGPAEVGRLLADLDRRQLNALAVVLAAMVDPDATLHELLGWVPPLDRPVQHPTLFAMSEEVEAEARMYERRLQRARRRPVIDLDATGKVRLGPAERKETAVLDDDSCKVLHAAYRRGDQSRAARLGYLEWERRRAERRRRPERQTLQSATG